jgi:hypothetical protein
MKKWMYRWIVAFAVIFTFLTCSKDSVPEDGVKNLIIIEENNRLQKVVPTAQVKANIEGFVVDETGKGISGAEVKAGGKTATT